MTQSGFSPGRSWSGPVSATIWSWPSRIHREVHYWPLTYTTFWLEHKMWGLAPAGYHIVNVLLHLLNTLLVWRLLLRLAVPGAWVAAAVFAAHPTHVESVAWIIERKDVLSGLFYLAAVLVWLRFLEQSRPWRYGLALLLFAAGLLSKSIVVTLPVALLIVQWWKEGCITVRDLRRVAPFFLVALRHHGSRSLSYGSRHGSLDYSLPERMLIASRALWFYAGKLVWPTDLPSIYPRWDISLGEPLGMAVPCRGGGAGGSAVVPAPQARARAAGRSLVLCGDAVAGAGLRESRLHEVLLGGRPLSIPGRHRGHGRPHRRRRARRRPAARPIEVGGDGSCRGGAGASWNDDLAPGGNLPGQDHLLQPHCLSQPRGAERSPRSAHYNLSIHLTRAGRPEEALAAARMAVENRPDQAKDLAILGSALIRTERFVEAEEILRRALEIDPGHKNSRRELAYMLGVQGRREEALETYRALLEIDSNYALAYAYIGDILVQLHRYAEAVEPLSKALTLINAAPSLTADLPTPGFVHELLGTALRELGRPQAGEAHFRRALQLKPRNMDELEQLARSHFSGEALPAGA